MKDINKMSWKQIKSEALKAHKIVRDSDKKQGIIGYRVMKKDDNRYLTFMVRKLNRIFQERLTMDRGHLDPRTTWA